MSKDMRTVVYWMGPGWYGPSCEGRWGDEVCRVDRVSSDKDESDPDRVARIMGIGTTVWLDAPEDLDYTADEVIDCRTLR